MPYFFILSYIPMTNIEGFVGSKVLITTDKWFFVPSGEQCRAVHGTLKAVHKAADVFGFEPSRGNANWFVEIGDMLIMGCQVLYCTLCDTVNSGNVNAFHTGEAIPGGILHYNRPSYIYVTD